ncbi:hypothetical protein GF389_05820 [Candidatus Dojkabacteria bacterium]|nr:hypothetical protein [Candidatus Dojkabacteria bacterium]
MAKIKKKSKNKDKDKNLAFVFPNGLSKRIKALQTDMKANSAGEVLVKAISLLELSIGRRIEIKDKQTESKWEVDEFEDYERRVDIKN